MVISRSYLRKINGTVPNLSVKVGFYRQGQSIKFKLFLVKEKYKQLLGILRLDFIQDNVCETHVSCRVPSKYRNKRLAVYLYSFAFDFALKHGIRVCSSTMQTDAAKRVWNSSTLNKHFDISYKHNRFFVNGVKYV